MVPNNAELARQVLHILVPVWAVTGAKAIEGAGKRAGEQIYDWLKTKFPAKAALERAAADPNGEDSRRALLAELRIALKDEAFRNELMALLPPELLKAEGGVHQTATATGDRNQQTQISGSGNQVS